MTILSRNHLMFDLMGKWHQNRLSFDPYLLWIVRFYLWDMTSCSHGARRRASGGGLFSRWAGERGQALCGRRWGGELNREDGHGEEKTMTGSVGWWPRVRCGCQGCVCAGVWRDGGRAGCGFSAVGIRVQAGKAGGKYEGRIAMGTYGWRWRSAFLFDSQGSRKSSGKHNLQENGHRRQNDHPGVSEEQQRQVGLKLTCLHYSPKVSGVWMKFQDAPTCTITFYRWTLFTDMLFAMKVIYHTNHKVWRLIRDWWTQNVLVQWQHVSACCSHFDVVRQDNA